MSQESTFVDTAIRATRSERVSFNSASLRLLQSCLAHRLGAPTVERRNCGAARRERFAEEEHDAFMVPLVRADRASVVDRVDLATFPICGLVGIAGPTYEVEIENSLVRHDEDVVARL